MSYNFFNPITLQGEFKGGYNKGIKGMLAVGRLLNIYKDISTF